MALTLGPLDQFQKKLIWAIYQLWRGLGPNFSSIGQLEAEIWHFGPNLDHIFGPSSGTLGPIPKKINLDNLPNMVGFRSKFQPPSIKSVGGVR